ncbi:MAG: CBS domain-containing protein [Chitinophagales bacterium]|nr:CBS domain-containing protein [Chitinophagales bacterium]
MKKREPVSKIMSRDIKSISKTDDLRDVVNIIRSNHIRHIPVIEGEDVVGIISSTDINRLTFGALFDNQDGVDEAVLNMLSVEQVMTANPKSVNSNDSIQDVAEILSQAEYHALPVKEDGHIVGIVTTTDLIKYLLDQY